MANRRRRLRLKDFTGRQEARAGKCNQQPARLQQAKTLFLLENLSSFFPFFPFLMSTRKHQRESGKRRRKRGPN